MSKKQMVAIVRYFKFIPVCMTCPINKGKPSHIGIS